MLKSKLDPKVLVAAPVSKRHGHLVKEWIENVRKFKPKCDIMLVENTLGDDSLFNELKSMKDVKIIKHKWKQASNMGDLKKGHRHSMQMLADCRENIRNYFLKSSKKYTHLFNLDVDVFPNPNYLSWLLAYDKDQVGPMIHVFAEKHKHRPATFFDGGVNMIRNKPMNYYTFKWLKTYKKMADSWIKNPVGFSPDDPKKPYLHKCYATSFGSLLIKRKVLEEVPFRTHPHFIMGEDMWFYKEAFDKGFEAWVDTSYRVPHHNVHWEKISSNDFNQNVTVSLQRIVTKEKNDSIRKLSGKSNKGKVNRKSKST